MIRLAIFAIWLLLAITLYTVPVHTWPERLGVSDDLNGIAEQLDQVTTTK